MKKLAIILAILLALGLAGYYYINAYFLPVQLKSILAERVGKSLRRSIAIGEIGFSPLKGVFIKDIFLYEKGKKDTPFLHIEETSFQVALPAVLKSKKIIIPSITIKNLSLRLVRFEENLWNFSDLIKKQGSSSGKSFPLLLGKIELLGANIDIEDYTQPEPLSETIGNINLKAQLSLQKGIRFALDAQLDEQAPLSVKGHFSPISKKLQARISGEGIDPDRYLVFVPVNLDVTLLDTEIKKADLQVEFSLKDKSLKLAGILDGSTELLTPIGITVKGDIITERLGVEKTPSGLKIILGKAKFPSLNLTLRNGNVIQADQLALTGFNYTRDGNILNLQTQVDQGRTTLKTNNSQISGNLSAENVTFHKDPDGITVTTTALAENADLRINDQPVVSGNLSSQQLDCRFHPEGHTCQGSLTLDNGVANIKGTNLTGDLSLPELELSFLGPKVDLSSPFTSTALSVLKNNISANGQADGKITLSFDRQKEVPLIYTGNADLKAVTVHGLPKIKTVEQLSGKVVFDNGSVSSRGLSLRAFSSTIGLKGALKDFSAPRLEITATTPSIDLAELKPIWPQGHSALAYYPNGSAEVRVSYNGGTRPFDKHALSFTAILNDATVPFPQAPADWPKTIPNVSGRISYAAGVVTWQDLESLIKKHRVFASGSLRNLDHPLIETDISSQDLDLHLKAQRSGDSLKILSLSGQYFLSQFDVSGDLRWTGKGIEQLALSGNLELNLQDLARAPFPIRDKIQTWDLSGKTDLDISFNGIPQDWQKASLSFSGTSPAISVKGMRIEDVSFNADNNAVPPGKAHLSGNFFGGTVDIVSHFALNRDGLPFSLEGKATAVDLALLKKNTSAKKKQIQGKLDLQMEAAGPLNDPKQILGQGKLAIREGHLWRINFLEGLGKALLIPELSEAVFTDASADFAIRNAKIETNNLLMESRLAKLHGKGFIGFDQTLDFNIQPSFMASEILHSASFKKGPTGFLASADGYISIRITGTLSKPSYRVDTLPTRVIEKATGALWQGVQGIFDELISN